VRIRFENIRYFTSAIIRYWQYAGDFTVFHCRWRNYTTARLQQ